MITASAAWSTSVTKSFGAFEFTCSRSRSSEARLMIAPGGAGRLDGGVEHGVQRLGHGSGWLSAVGGGVTAGAACGRAAK
jgi:hypothetical protein